MGCFESCRKWTIVSFNLIFFILGISVVVVGAIFLCKLKSLNATVPSSYDYLTSTPIILLVFGSLVVIISILGTLGVIKENIFLLYVLTITLLVIFVFQILLSILTFWTISNQHDLAVSVNSSVEEVFRNYTANKEVVDFVQSSLECCGTDSSQFWKNQTLPKSCCDDEGCKKVYEDSCQNSVYNYLMQTVRFTGMTILAISPLQVIGAVLSLSLANTLKNRWRRYGKYMK